MAKKTVAAKKRVVKVDGVGQLHVHSSFNNIIVTYVEGEVGKPVVLIKLVCPDCVFYFRLWRLLAGLDLYILVYHNVMLTAGGRKGQFHAFRKGECKIRNKRAIIK